MFQALPQGSLIEAAPNHIVGLHRSLNSPVVSLGGGNPIQCRSHILGVYNAGGNYTLFVVLNPVGRSWPLLFRSDPVGIPIADYRNQELAALELVQRHGFVMERIELSSLNPDDRDRLMRELPLSTPPAPEDEMVPLRLAEEIVAEASRAKMAESPPSLSVDSEAPLDLAEEGARIPSVAGAGEGLDLGLAPEEAIAVLGRLLASF